LHLAISKIDAPLKISSMLGVISGVLLPSSIAYTALTLNQRPVDYSSPFRVSSFLLPGMTYALFVIVGAVILLFARMNEDRRGVLGFLVFTASVFAIIGAFGILSFPGP